MYSAQINPHGLMIDIEAQYIIIIIVLSKLDRNKQKFEAHKQIIRRPNVMTCCSHGILGPIATCYVTYVNAILATILKFCRIFMTHRIVRSM